MPLYDVNVYDGALDDSHSFRVWASVSAGISKYLHRDRNAAERRQSWSVWTRNIPVYEQTYHPTTDTSQSSPLSTRCEPDSAGCSANFLRQVIEYEQRRDTHHHALRVHLRLHLSPGCWCYLLRCPCGCRSILREHVLLLHERPVNHRRAVGDQVCPALPVSCWVACQSVQGYFNTWS